MRYLRSGRGGRWQRGKLSLSSLSGRRHWVRCCLLLPAAVPEDGGLGLGGGCWGRRAGRRGVHNAAPRTLHGKSNGAAQQRESLA